MGQFNVTEQGLLLEQVGNNQSICVERITRRSVYNTTQYWHVM